MKYHNEHKCINASSGLTLTTDRWFFSSSWHPVSGREKKEKWVRLRIWVTKDHIVMAKQPGQSISKTAALVGCSWSAVGNQRQTHGQPRLTEARGEWRLARVDDISTDHSGAHPDPCPVPKAQRRGTQELDRSNGKRRANLIDHVFFYITWMDVFCLPGEHLAAGCTVRRRRGLSCGCYFDTYHLP